MTENQQTSIIRLIEQVVEKYFTKNPQTENGSDYLVVIPFEEFGGALHERNAEAVCRTMWEAVRMNLVSLNSKLWKNVSENIYIDHFGGNIRIAFGMITSHLGESNLLEREELSQAFKNAPDRAANILGYISAGWCSESGVKAFPKTGEYSYFGDIEISTYLLVDQLIHSKQNEGSFVEKRESHGGTRYIEGWWHTRDWITFQIKPENIAVLKAACVDDMVKSPSAAVEHAAAAKLEIGGKAPE